MKPWMGYMEPFKIFGNLYFVGTDFVSSHIIDTGDDLVMIDSGYPQCTYLTLENIRKLGFSPYDIKYILHSHGHYDHIGGTRAIVELTGAKTAIGRPDKDYVNGKLDLTWAKELGYEFFEMFEPDILIDDGDIIRCGNTEIKCIATPGHTPGVLSYFFNVTDGESTYRAAMFGGAGINSLRKAFLDKYALPHSLRDDFVNSLKKVRGEQVDILVGNHPADAKTKENYALMLTSEKNPFLNPDAWTRHIDYCKKRFDDMVARGE